MGLLFLIYTGVFPPIVYTDIYYPTALESLSKIITIGEKKHKGQLVILEMAKQVLLLCIIITIIK